MSEKADDFERQLLQRLQKHRASSIPWIGQISEEMAALQPRAWIIVLAAGIDGMLEELLKATLRPQDGSLSDALFVGPTAPMGSFASRIDMARVLGLIDNDLASALHGLRKQRNKAAHVGEPIDIGALRSPMDRMTKYFRETGNFRNLLRGMPTRAPVDRTDGAPWSEWSAAGLSAMLLLDQNRFLFSELLPIAEYVRRTVLSREHLEPSAD